MNRSFLQANYLHEIHQLEHVYVNKQMVPIES